MQRGVVTDCLRCQTVQLQSRPAATPQTHQRSPRPRPPVSGPPQSGRSWPLAMTGMVTASLMALIMVGSLMRATPPSCGPADESVRRLKRSDSKGASSRDCTLRISAGTRSRAITAVAPASSAMRASSAGSRCEHGWKAAESAMQAQLQPRTGSGHVHDDTTLQHLGPCPPARTALLGTGCARILVASGTTSYFLFRS